MSFGQVKQPIVTREVLADDGRLTVRLTRDEIGIVRGAINEQLKSFDRDGLGPGWMDLNRILRALGLAK